MNVKPEFDTMNETDVREIVVRPLLHRLGFAHGTQANIRTEVPLKYDRAFLGRKSPTKDPPLAGRADYICEAVSYGRWVVEVKSPNQPLSRDDAEQAHTYCAHPEISATYFLITNGRLFRLYAVGVLNDPLMEWSHEEIEESILTLFNIVGYEALKKLTQKIRPDVNKSLGEGLPSKVKIVGGEVTYGEHYSDHPLLASNALVGMVGAITGISIDRVDDGRIRATISVRGPYQQFEELNKLAGMGDFIFYSSDEYVSVDITRPTIFQNVVEGRLEPGATFKLLPNLPEIPMPIGFQFTVFTEATGYFDSDGFKGVLSFDYDYQFIRGRPTGIPQLDAMAAQAPPTAKLVGEGTFRILIAPM